MPNLENTSDGYNFKKKKQNYFSDNALQRAVKIMTSNKMPVSNAGSMQLMTFVCVLALYKVKSNNNRRIKAKSQIP